MARRQRQYNREITPDYKYKSVEVAKFINHLMLDGKKSVAERVLYKALEMAKKKTKQDELKIFREAINNVAPILEVKSKRIGGANYQIPIEVRGERQIALSMRWIIEAARGVKGRPMHIKLANELMSAANKEGVAINKRLNVQKMAEANRAFAHFA